MNLENNNKKKENMYSEKKEHKNYFVYFFQIFLFCFPFGGFRGGNVILVDFPFPLRRIYASRLVF